MSKLATYEIPSGCDFHPYLVPSGKYTSKAELLSLKTECPEWVRCEWIMILPGQKIELKASLILDYFLTDYIKIDEPKDFIILFREPKTKDLFVCRCCGICEAGEYRWGASIDDLVTEETITLKFRSIIPWRKIEDSRGFSLL